MQMELRLFFLLCTVLSGILSEELDAPDRREMIKAAMLHAWGSYEAYAWGYDQLQPLTRNGINDFGAIGLTILDAMDTLHIMGLTSQFQKARNFVARLNFKRDLVVNVFETTIRVLGSLISTYDLTNDAIFLTKAKELADRLLPAFNTETGIPYGKINLLTGEAFSPAGSSVLAELGTLELEFIALAQRTGDMKYQNKVVTVINQLQRISPVNGLLPEYVNPHNLVASGKITFGGTGDSFYEYLLKTWILTGKKYHGYRVMWERSMDGLVTLLRKTPANALFLVERQPSGFVFKMEELDCFVPAMLVLGSHDATPQKKTQYLAIAQQLTNTCYKFFQSSPIAIAADTYIYNGAKKGLTIQDPKNIMRPELLESLYYMWRETGDETYRDQAWNIFLAYEKNSRVQNGYSGHISVLTGKKDNKMQSYFLAESLKYLYLLHSPPNLFPFDQWVFNTEAHPILIK